MATRPRWAATIMLEKLVEFAKMIGPEGIDGLLLSAMSAAQLINPDGFSAAIDVLDLIASADRIEKNRKMLIYVLDLTSSSRQSLLISPYMKQLTPEDRGNEIVLNRYSTGSGLLSVFPDGLRENYDFEGVFGYVDPSSHIGGIFSPNNNMGPASHLGFAGALRNRLPHLLKQDQDPDHLGREDAINTSGWKYNPETALGKAQCVAAYTVTKATEKALRQSMKGAMMGAVAGKIFGPPGVVVLAEKGAVLGAIAGGVEGASDGYNEGLVACGVTAKKTTKEKKPDEQENNNNQSTMGYTPEPDGTSGPFATEENSELGKIIELMFDPNPYIDLTGEDLGNNHHHLEIKLNWEEIVNLDPDESNPTPIEIPEDPGERFTDNS